MPPKPTTPTTAATRPKNQNQHPPAAAVGSKAGRAATAAATETDNSAHDDEYGLQRQPTTSVHGTLLRGGSFLHSVHAIRVKEAAKQLAKEQRAKEQEEKAGNDEESGKKHRAESSSSSSSSSDHEEQSVSRRGKSGSRRHHDSDNDDSGDHAVVPLLSTVNTPQGRTSKAEGAASSKQRPQALASAANVADGEVDEKDADSDDDDAKSPSADGGNHKQRAAAAAKKLSITERLRGALSGRTTAAGSEAGSDCGGGAFAREPTMLHTSHQLLPSPLPEKKYTVVLDLDETVIYGREGTLSARAHLKVLLRTLDSCAEVVVWTAGEKAYAKQVVREINSEGVIRHLVYRDDVWFNEADYTKDLRKLGRDTDYVLIVENTPDCVRENPNNGIIVSDFEGNTEKRDETLLKLGELVVAMVASGKTVPEYLPTSRLLRPQTVETEDGRKIDIFFLSPRVRRTPKEGPASAEPGAAAAAAADEEEEKVVKVNRDKKAPAPQSAAASTTNTSAPKVDAKAPSLKPAIAKVAKAALPATPANPHKAPSAASSGAGKKLQRIKSDESATGRPSTGARKMPLVAPRTPTSASGTQRK